MEELRHERARRLRQQGKTFPKIGDEMGCSGEIARILYLRALRAEQVMVAEDTLLEKITSGALRWQDVDPMQLPLSGKARCAVEAGKIGRAEQMLKWVNSNELRNMKGVGATTIRELKAALYDLMTAPTPAQKQEAGE